MRAERGDIRDQGREGDGTGTLDIVVEHWDILVLFHESVCVGHSEILKVNHGIGEQFAAVFDESSNKLVVVFASESRTFPAHVQRVREEGVVVGSDVQDDGQDTVGVDTGSEGVQGRL